MQTKFIIVTQMSTRPDLTYYYRGQTKNGSALFGLQKATAKRYNFIEEADRDARILAVVEPSQTFKVATIRCRA